MMGRVFVLHSTEVPYKTYIHTYIPVFIVLKFLIKQCINEKLHCKNGQEPHLLHSDKEGGSFCEAKCDQSLLLGMYTGSIILYVWLWY